MEEKAKVRFPYLGGESVSSNRVKRGIVERIIPILPSDLVWIHNIVPLSYVSGCTGKSSILSGRMESGGRDSERNELTFEFMRA